MISQARLGPSAIKRGGETLERPIPGVFASGGADGHDGNYFGVATIRRGDPPAVKVEGSGLHAKVAVGKQVIAFDGTRVVPGK